MSELHNCREELRFKVQAKPRSLPIITLGALIVELSRQTSHISADMDKNQLVFVSRMLHSNINNDENGINYIFIISSS